MSYYFSLQYSAIQKTVMRHNRLWSIAGISHGLAHLNEVTLFKIIKDNGGNVLVSGGGKFTAKFSDETPVADAIRKIIRKTIATSYPMLEFQISEVAQAYEFKQASKSLIEGLNDQKKHFRGYGVSFNPHLKICPECGEYPVQSTATGKTRSKSDVLFCAVCHNAQDKAWSFAGVDIGRAEYTATVARIYHNFLRDRKFKIPVDFEDLSAYRRKNSDTIPRMAVWFSDLNNMKGKVPLWLHQEDEEITTHFGKVKDENISIITESLKKTFKGFSGEYLPFRLIVAGGDDLCIAMDEPFIVPFCCHYSQNMKEAINNITDSKHPLNPTFLKAKNEELCKEDEEWKKKYPPDKEPTPYCFGGSFVITSIHTPFRQIHEVGEKLMSEAKRKTNREGNSVHWAIMATDKDPLESRLKFEKPLLIGDRYDSCLSFNEYCELRRKYKKKISGSKRQRIITEIINKASEDAEVEDWLIRNASKETDKIYSQILTDDSFYEKKSFRSRRLATLLELMEIEDFDSTGGEDDRR